MGGSPGIPLEDNHSSKRVGRKCYEGKKSLGKREIVGEAMNEEFFNDNCSVDRMVRGEEEGRGKKKGEGGKKEPHSRGVWGGVIKAPAKMKDFLLEKAGSRLV